MAPSFTTSGITFISAGYRLAPQHVFPAGLEDCERALDWVRKEISDYVFIGGHSAGGHYAALIAATRGANLVRGCLPISGVYEFGDGSGLTAHPRFLGEAPAQIGGRAPAFNCKLRCRHFCSRSAARTFHILLDRPNALRSPFATPAAPSPRSKWPSVPTSPRAMRVANLRGHGFRWRSTSCQGIRRTRATRCPSGLDICRS